MLKAEGKGLNRHITFCLFCCHIFYKSIIYLHTKKNKNSTGKTNLCQNTKDALQKTVIQTVNRCTAQTFYNFIVTAVSAGKNHGNP